MAWPNRRKNGPGELSAFRQSSPLGANKEIPSLQHLTQYEDGSYYLSDPGLNYAL